MSDPVQVDQVIEIKPDGKYVLVVPAWADEYKFEETVTVVSDWWDSDDPILIIGNGLRLVRIEDKPSVAKEQDL